MSWVYSSDQKLLLWLNHLGEGSPHREIIIHLLATVSPLVIIGTVLLVVFRYGGGWRMFARAFLSALIALSIWRLVSQLCVRPRPFECFPDRVLHMDGLIAGAGSFPSIPTVPFWGLIGTLVFGKYRAWGVFTAVFGTGMLAGGAAAGVQWPVDLVGGGLVGLASAWAVSVLADGRKAAFEPGDEEEIAKEENI